MVSTELLIRVGGVLHLALFFAGVLVPFVLNWWVDLAKLSRLTRQIVWIHGVFLVFVIVGFGAASLLMPHALAAGTPLGRAVCGFIGLFWLSRLAVQFFYFDAEPHLRGWFLRVAYRALSGVFTYLAVVYGCIALFTVAS